MQTDPVSASERIQLLDILRGIAIFGMFTVNMTADIWWGDIYIDTELGSADFASMLFVNLFASGKFITIFSFLFGIGFFVQAQRQESRGGSVAVFWTRRLAGLLMIGALANTFTLPAWILVDYGMFGFGLLLFYRLRPRAILMAALACIIFAKIFGSIIPSYTEAPETLTAPTPTVLDAIHESRELLQREGDFLDLASNSILHMALEISNWRYFVGDLDILGLMLLGLYIARRGAIWDRDVQVSIARKTLPWLLGIGFLGCLIWIAMDTFGLGDETSIHHGVISELWAWPFGMRMMGLGYVAAITLLVSREAWQKRLAPFAAVGRMAFTNYLFTGFVAAFISYQWGLGLFGEIYPAAGLLIVAALLPVQIIASQWWLARFTFGPFEWLWRAWTYGKFPPMRRQLQADAADTGHSG